MICMLTRVTSTMRTSSWRSDSFNGLLDELRRAQQGYGYDAAVDRVSAYVDEVLLDGACEVIEEQRS